MEDKWDLEKLKAFYGSNQLQTKVITPINNLLLQYIRTLKPNTVFEFGCNQGKNLHYLEQIGITHVYGIDINNLEHPKSTWGDESTLKTYDDNCCDVAFTCSVLNHLPLLVVDDILHELKRMANTVVLGEITHKMDNPRWFQHDYESMGFTKIGGCLQRPNDKTYGLYTSKGDK